MLTCLALMGGFFLSEADGSLLVNPALIREFRITDCGRHYAKEQCLEGYDGNTRWSWQIPEDWQGYAPATVLARCAEAAIDPLSYPQKLPEE